MQLRQYTKNQQIKFSLYCKTNKSPIIDGLTPGRIGYYRKLIYGVIDDSLRSAFPLTENLLQSEEWSNLVDHFISEHKCQTPIIWQLPYEFLEFIQNGEFEVKLKYPQLNDLLIFEWKEIEIYMMEDLNVSIKNISYDFNDTCTIILNKEYDILHLEYPVHRKPAKDITISDKNEYFVLVYRFNDKVQFFDISAILCWYIKSIDENRYSVIELIEETLKLTPELETSIIRANINSFIKALHKKGFILGFINEEKNDN